MTNMPFVFMNKDIQTETVKIRANEIGIVQASTGEFYTVLLIISQVTVSLAAHDVEFFEPSQTGDRFETKICNICHRKLPTTEFSRNQNGINNRIIRRPSCNECRVSLNGVKVSAKERKKWEANRPNLQPFLNALSAKKLPFQNSPAKLC